MTTAPEVEAAPFAQPPPGAKAMPLSDMPKASMREQLKDQIEMPGYNPTANAGRGDWGLRDVSKGNVFADPIDIVRCIDHGAMNSVSQSRTIWRCLACGRAAYRMVSPKAENPNG